MLVFCIVSVSAFFNKNSQNLNVMQTFIINIKRKKLSHRRAGPGRFNLGDDGQQYVIQHAFDGLSFVHRFEISAEKQSIRYNSRHIAEGAERLLVEDPERNQIFFGQISKVSPWRAFTNLLERLDKMAFRPRKETFETPSDRNVGVTVNALFLFLF